MKLKTRLTISFFIIILVPIALAGAVLCLISQYQIKSIEQNYGLKDVTYEDLSNSTKMLNRFAQAIYEEVQVKATVDPESFLDREYQEQLNKDLGVKYSYLIVRQEEEIVFTGITGQMDSIQDELPSYGSGGSRYIGKDIQALVKQVDFQTSDGIRGSVFLITPIQNMIPQIKGLLRDMLVSIVMILILTSTLLTFWIYRGIMKPLRKLKIAAQQIKDGNLDFILTTDCDDEIGELCRDFEEMRLRLKASAEEKIEYDKENKELISNISHDLKTPITAVKGYVEGIMDGVADTPEKMEKYIRTIYNKSNEMDRLINELTFYSKIDTNRIPYTFSRLDVADYFEDCVDELTLDLESKNVEIAYFNYTEKGVSIIADAEQLKRVINNIVTNSSKYMDKKKGFINIRVKDVGDFIQVEIEDNGKGIAQKDLPYIFDRFYRTDASRNSSKGGSGIGLSIVSKIIEDHGGKIWATSKLDTGTVMYFVLRKYQEVNLDE
jgi:signal transduction histidine kinase